MPNFALEKAAGGRVAGVDEAGRGPLAGPVVAAAVVFPAGVPRRLAVLLDDSKKLTAEQRQEAYVALLACKRVEIAVGAASVAEISRLNILHAAMLAMRRAVRRLPAMPDLALVDGNYPPKLDCTVRCVVGGDALCLSIAAASIVAKVVRDRAMLRLAARFPVYGWASNAGYATAVHRAALLRYGPTRHHRPTFGTVAQLTLALEMEAAETAAVAPLPLDTLPLDTTTLDTATLDASGGDAAVADAVALEPAALDTAALQRAALQRAEAVLADLAPAGKRVVSQLVD